MDAGFEKALAALQRVSDQIDACQVNADEVGASLEALNRSLDRLMLHCVVASVGGFFMMLAAILIALNLASHPS